MEDLRLHAVDEHHIWLNGRQFISLNAVNQMMVASKEEIDWLKKCLNDLPKPKRAKWEQTKVIKGYLCCSACRNCYVLPEWLDESHTKWKFCPNCGAAMYATDIDTGRKEAKTNDS